MENMPKMTADTAKAHSYAISFAEKNYCMFYTPEIFLGILIKEEMLDYPLAISHVDEEKLLQELMMSIGESGNLTSLPFGAPEPSAQYIQMMAAAETAAISCGKASVDIPHVISAMLKLEESMAAYMLKKHIGDETLFMAMLEGMYSYKSTDGQADGWTSDDFDTLDDIDYMPDDDDGTFADSNSKPKSWRTMVTCLNDEAKSHNPLIGREKEMERIMQILCRLDKNNPLLIGEPGVGKTAMAYGLVEKINSNDCPKKLQGCKIYMMDMASLIAGTQYRGEFEKKLKMVLEGAQKEGNAIIYIDEIHNIIGAGKSSDGALDASNMLKPYLENGELRFMGSTTYGEFNKYMAGSNGITRRFQQVDIAEPSVDDTLRIMAGLKKRYEQFHNTVIKNDIMEYAVRACAKHISDRRFPDKAIDLIDEAGAYLELHPKNHTVQYIDKEIVNMVLSRICKIDAEALKTEDNKTLESLQQQMLTRVFGQDEAVNQVVEAVQMAKAGLTDDDKPMASLLFVGPTGVGKTEVARSLAEVLGVELTRFDMSEYAEKHSVAKLIGSPAGYVGYEDGGLLTDAIRKKPNCVLLLDEIEKAHSDIYNILLQVMDYARLTDNRGRQADFHNVVLVMTSNAGAQHASQASIGFGGGISRGEAMLRQVRKSFKPEFLNRLSGTVVFHDMDHDMAVRILHKKLSLLQQKLSAKKIELTIGGEAEEWLLQKGFTKEYGAREMDRVIARHLKPLLMREILFGKLRKGGKANITVNERKEIQLAL